MQTKTICAVLVNDKCEEFCEEFFPAWEKMKELGCKIIQAEISLIP